jgi:hypothetical protein
MFVSFTIKITLLLLLLLLRDLREFYETAILQSPPPPKKLSFMSSSPFRGVQGPGLRIENRTWDWLGSNSLEIMDRHPYSPDLALKDFRCFRSTLRNALLVRDLQHTST